MLPIASRVRFARLPRFAAATLAALPLLAADANASHVTLNLNGKVQVVLHGSANINAESDLAGKGVSAGVPASLLVVVEDATPGVPLEPIPGDTFIQYDMAIVDIKLSAGTWDAHFAPPAGKEASNFVQVADNQSYAGFDSDSWGCTALGVDTNNILSQGATPSPYGAFQVHLVNSPPVPATTGALVQDLSKYKDWTDSTCSFTGPGGTITFNFAQAPAGAGASLARKGQLKAAGTLGSKVLAGLGKLTAGGPDKDPQGTKKDALLQSSSDKFQVQFVAAINKALKKGGSAPLGESSKAGATKYLMAGLQTQSNAITADEDSSNAIDRAMRGAILRALAAECKADFIAHSKDVVLPDINKLNAKIEKDRETFIGKANAAMDKALKKGTTYFGPSAEAIANDLKPFVNAFVDLTGTGL
jgi:hypothetical protein